MSIKKLQDVWIGKSIYFDVGANHLWYKMSTITLRNFNTGYSGGRSSVRAGLKPLLF
jgi:hypothetical protein